jgi:glutamyl/glutaminyl-tRNA synthetase
MGWSYDDHTEFFTLPELIEKFSLERLNPAPAAINFTKLDHFNGLHIRALPTGELATRLRPFLEGAGLIVDLEILEKVAPIVQQRLTTLDDVVDMEVGNFVVWNGEEYLELDREGVLIMLRDIFENVEDAKLILQGKENVRRLFGKEGLERLQREEEEKCSR